jgi:ABC-type transporter Mla subunit MlaD
VGAATNGRGQDINALLGDLNQLSVQSGPDLQTFSDRSQNLDSILTGLDNVGGNLADQRDHLAGVQTHLNQVLGTIADNDPAFKRFISEGDTSLGHGLTQFSGEHQNINTSIAELRPALDKLNPVLVDVDNLTHQFDAFMKIADPLVADILASVSSSNQNRNNTSCDAAVATAGCGGFYLRQPTILANSPADQEKAGAAAASARGATSKSSHSPAPPSFTPGLPLLPIPNLQVQPPASPLQGPALPALPSGPGILQASPSPSIGLPGLSQPVGYDQSAGISGGDMSLAETALLEYRLQ